MIKIGILGSDSTHAHQFAAIINGLKQFDYDFDAKVTHIYGHDFERTKEVASKSSITSIVNDPHEIMGKVDAVMILFRKGDEHLKYALPFIRKGMPIFIDKPLAISIHDCEILLEKALKYDSLLTSFSTVRFSKDIQKIKSDFDGNFTSGYFTGPCDFKSKYGGAYFYGNHVIEMMLELFGYNIKSIYTGHNKTYDKVSTVEYDDNKTGIINFVDKGRGEYFVSVINSDKHTLKKIDISDCYQEGMKVFLNMLKTGQKPLNEREMLKPIKLLKHIVENNNEIKGF